MHTNSNAKNGFQEKKFRYKRYNDFYCYFGFFPRLFLTVNIYGIPLETLALTYLKVTCPIMLANWRMIIDKRTICLAHRALNQIEHRHN